MLQILRLAAVLFAAVALLVPPPARAADPYEINAVLSLTGNLAFVGTTQLQAIKAVEAYVNKSGGINGRQVSFVIADDQSNPQTAVQLVQGLVAKHVPLILGPSGTGPCGAIVPIVATNGPVTYCLSNGAQAPAGGYVFLTLYSGEAGMAVIVRNLRERGLKKVAFISTVDATGQDAEKSLDAALARPENASMQIVTRQHFAPTDLSVAAQITSIKAAAPDALIGWVAGTAAGTLFRGLNDAGVNLPTFTSASNLNPIFFKQYGSITPKNLYFNASSYYGADIVTNPAHKAAIATITSVLAAVNAKPDQIEISAWDPAMLVVDALRKLGPDVTAAKLHDYLTHLKGWVGVNGPYDFPANPQRGLGENSAMAVRWDVDKGVGVAASRFGGAALPGK